MQIGIQRYMGCDYMERYAFYYDERDTQFKRTSLKELKALEKSNLKEFLYRQCRLFRNKSKTTPMTLVRNGEHQGFRLKGEYNNGTNIHSRGEYESPLHQGSKEAIASLNKICIFLGSEKVTLHIRRAEIEKRIVCNGSLYEVDVFLLLDRTEPSEYYRKLNGKVWLEVCHTCKVDSKQAEDFAVERETLLEYQTEDLKIICDTEDTLEYERSIERLAKNFENRGIVGHLICETRQQTLRNWHLSKKGNWTASVDDVRFTIIPNRDQKTYTIVYGEPPNYISCYNKKQFSTIEVAKKNADYLAYKLVSSIA